MGKSSVSSQVLLTRKSYVQDIIIIAINLLKYLVFLSLSSRFYPPSAQIAE